MRLLSRLGPAALLLAAALEARAAPTDADGDAREETTAEIMARWDLDGDGLIDRDEFTQGVEDELPEDMSGKAAYMNRFVRNLEKEWEPIDEDGDNRMNASEFEILDKILRAAQESDEL